MSYEHGDHIAVYPRNNPGVIEAACKALRWDADAVFTLSVPADNPEMLPAPFACPTTVRLALTHHCELLQHPDKAALQLLATCASDSAQAARLRHLAGREGKDEFAEYIVASQRSLIEVLQVRAADSSCSQASAGCRGRSI
jgi:NADPH-ferrihemoprotein reductase